MDDSVNTHMEDYIRQVEALAEAGKKLRQHRDLRDLLNTPDSIARHYLASMNWPKEDGADQAMLNRYLRSSKAADKYFRDHLLDIERPVAFYDDQVSIFCDIEEIFLRFESVMVKDRLIKELKLKVEVN